VRRALPLSIVEEAEEREGAIGLRLVVRVPDVERRPGQTRLQQDPGPVSVTFAAHVGEEREVGLELGELLAQPHDPLEPPLVHQVGQLRAHGGVEGDAAPDGPRHVSARPVRGALLGLSEDAREAVHRREIELAASQRTPRLLGLGELPRVRSRELIRSLDLGEALGHKHPRGRRLLQLTGLRISPDPKAQREWQPEAERRSGLATPPTRRACALAIAGHVAPP